MKGMMGGMFAEIAEEARKEAKEEQLKRAQSLKVDMTEMKRLINSYGNPKECFTKGDEVQFKDGFGQHFLLPQPGNHMIFVRYLEPFEVERDEGGKFKGFDCVCAVGQDPEDGELLLYTYNSDMLQLA